MKPNTNNNNNNFNNSDNNDNSSNNKKKKSKKATPPSPSLTPAARRGRPLGSRDQQHQHQQQQCDDKNNNNSARRRCGARRKEEELAPFNVTQCKLELLKILLYTRDYGHGWRIDNAVRYLFAHTRAFQEWSRANRRVDSLAQQMRIWVHRDIVPLIKCTCFFTKPLPDDGFPPRRRDDALALLKAVCHWVKHEGAALDCLLLTQEEPAGSCGFRFMHEPSSSPTAAAAASVVVVVVEEETEAWHKWVTSGEDIWRARRGADRLAAAALSLQWDDTTATTTTTVQPSPSAASEEQQQQLDAAEADVDVDEETSFWDSPFSWRGDDDNDDAPAAEASAFLSDREQI